MRGVNGAIALATMYFLTRMLTPTEYGVYALGVAAIGTLSSMLFQWIAVTVSRFYALHLANPDVLLGAAYRIFIPLATLFALACAAYSLWLPAGGPTLWLVIAVGSGTIASGLHLVSIQVANARIEPLRYGLLTASRGALALLGAVLFINAGFGGDGAVFSAALASIAAVLFFGQRRRDKSVRDDGQLRRQMIAYGLPLTVTYIATMILDYSDRFIIGWWLDASAVAGYAAPYDLCQQTVGVALNVFFLVSYPRITRAWEQGGASAARQAMVPLARSMLCATPLVLGVFAGMADDISTLIFGSGIRRQAAQLMPWITVAVGVAFCKGYFLDIAFQLTRTTRTQSKIIVVMALLNVALNVVLLPYLGIIGAALSTLIAFSCGALMSWWLGRGLAIYPVGRRDLAAAVFVFCALMLVLRYEPWSASLAQPWAFASRLLLALGAYLFVALAVNLGNLRPALRRALEALHKRDGGTR